MSLLLTLSMTNKVLLFPTFSFFLLRQLSPRAHRVHVADCAPHCPLLFNLTADVAESTPLDPGSPGYAAGMALVETAIAAYETSLAADMRHHPDMRSDLSTKICCNPDNVVCRCEETQ